MIVGYWIGILFLANLKLPFGNLATYNPTHLPPLSWNQPLRKQKKRREKGGGDMVGSKYIR